MSIDLTNSDDEGHFQSFKRRRDKRGKQSVGDKSPAQPHDFVDLTSDTPPSRRARSREGGALGKVAIDFESEGLVGAAAGGAAVQSPSKSIDAGGGNSSGSGSEGHGYKGVGQPSSSAERAREKEPASDPDCSVLCPICSVDMKAGSRILLSCDHFACSECLAKVRENGKTRSTNCCFLFVACYRMTAQSDNANFRAAGPGRWRMPYMQSAHLCFRHAKISDGRAGALLFGAPYLLCVIFPVFDIHVAAPRLTCLRCDTIVPCVP